MQTVDGLPCLKCYNTAVPESNYCLAHLPAGSIIKVVRPKRCWSWRHCWHDTHAPSVWVWVRSNRKCQDAGSKKRALEYRCCKCGTSAYAAYDRMIHGYGPYWFKSSLIVKVEKT